MTKKGEHLSEETKAKIRLKLLGRRCCMSSEFKKGQVSWNKGLKGIHFSPKTEFKKGNIPSNYRGGYKLCKDGIYVLIKKGHFSYGKYKVGKYEQLARVKYREAFGDFPKNKIVFHKDGDIFNNEIDNLELISRGDLLKRNQYKTKKNCVICGKEFFSRTGYSKTCGKECYKQNCKNINRIYQLIHKEKHKEYNKRYREKLKKNKNINIYSSIPQYL